MKMDIQIIIAISGLIASIGTIAAVLIARKSLLADHERRKKQATIEFCSNISNISNTETVPLRTEIKKSFGNDYGYNQIHPSDERWTT